MSRNERAIVEDVRLVVDAGRADVLRTVGYGLYVAALLLTTYGLTLANAFFLTQDPAWLRTQVVSWRAGLVLAVALVAGVVAAWREARDLLRARGVAVPPGATVRDLAALIPSTVDSPVREGLEWLARQVDVALWSGAATDASASITRTAKPRRWARRRSRSSRRDARPPRSRAAPRRSAAR